MRNLAKWVACLLASIPVTGLAELKVLFVGNSFTIGESASVPVIFDRLAQAGGHGDPTTVMRAVGGMDYKFHAIDPTTLATINSQDWDYVILQNYSTEPTHLVDGTHSISDHHFYGTSLYDSVIASSPGARVILFETWSRAAAHSLITGTSSPTSFASTTEFQSELRLNYRNLAEALTSNHPSNLPVWVGPVGDAWENAGGLLPPSSPGFVDLFGSDNYHGDDDGYYLAAAVFYSRIFNQSPVGLSTAAPVASLNLNMNVAPAYLENVAWSTVQSVPEPASVGFLMTGLATALLHRRRRLSS
jgi:hypothetical protein